LLKSSLDTCHDPATEAAAGVTDVRWRALVSALGQGRTWADNVTTERLDADHR